MITKKKSVFVLLFQVLLVGALYSCVENQLPETVIYPRILGITVGGVKATQNNDVFSVVLPSNSPVLYNNVQATDIIFTNSKPEAVISPAPPYNFRDAVNNTIGLKISLNGKSKTYYLQVKKTDPPVQTEGAVYATWIMIWNGSTESWFNPDSYNGATTWVNNTWKATNWNDNAQVDEFVLNMKNAGIKVIICDLTNGFKWMNKVKYIQDLCAKYNMKVCVAENYGGKFTTFDTDAKSVYDNLAGPNAANKDAYFHKDGKPLIVCYCTKPNYEALLTYSSEMRSYFNISWSSGEQSQTDKWGWQLEPKVGPMPSGDAMFVTSAIKWASGKPELWRKSLAWLDYNFLIARQNKPKYIIVGSYDDIHERNGWLITNTTNSLPGQQFRNISGAISTDAHYNRVCEWLSNGEVSTIPGGLIKDGCYMIKNKKSKLFLQMRNGNGEAASVLEQSTSAVFQLNRYFWFYHLGDNVYRIIPLASGLPLTPKDASKVDNAVIEQNWDDDVANQKWKMELNSTGEYLIKNMLSDKYISVKNASTASGTEMIQFSKSNADHQIWILETVVQL